MRGVRGRGRAPGGRVRAGPLAAGSEGAPGHRIDHPRTPDIPDVPTITERRRALQTQPRPPTDPDADDAIGTVPLAGCPQPPAT